MRKNELSRDQLIGWNDQVNVLFKNLKKTFREKGETVIGFATMKDANKIIRFANLAHKQIKQIIKECPYLKEK